MVQLLLLRVTAGIKVSRAELARMLSLSLSALPSYLVVHEFVDQSGMPAKQKSRDFYLDFLDLISVGLAG